MTKTELEEKIDLILLEIYARAFTEGELGMASTKTTDIAIRQIKSLLREYGECLIELGQKNVMESGPGPYKVVIGSDGSYTIPLVSIPGVSWSEDAIERQEDFKRQEKLRNEQRHKQKELLGD